MDNKSRAKDLKMQRRRDSMLEKRVKRYEGDAANEFEIKWSCYEVGTIMDLKGMDDDRKGCVTQQDVRMYYDAQHAIRIAMCLKREAGSHSIAATMMIMHVGPSSCSRSALRWPLSRIARSAFTRARGAQAQQDESLYSTWQAYAWSTGKRWALKARDSRLS